MTTEPVPNIWIGRILPFEMVDDFALYQMRFEQAMSLNGIRDDQQKLKIFLAHVGPDVNALVDTWRPTMAPPGNAESFAAVSGMLLEHFSKPKEVAERYTFYMRNQNAAESYEDYVRALRTLAQTCNFDDHLANALRDRFVAGIQNGSVREILLMEMNLTITKALRIARSMEANAQPTAEANRLRWTYTRPRRGGVAFVEEERARQRARYANLLLRTAQLTQEQELLDATTAPLPPLPQPQPIAAIAAAAGVGAAAAAASGAVAAVVDKSCRQCARDGRRSCSACRTTEPTDDSSQVRMTLMADFVPIFWNIYT